ncbi:phosphatidylinositol-specific phospholipase C domain-containing protein [Streptomyces sp. NPDC127084]|uniref:phosphatidylinositol-specific phospholipase C domain-containing protein n=1 Tax=Streptomyces sp. NPDC127084 TaxID=3347133 RepID=UPI00365EBEF3
MRKLWRTTVPAIVVALTGIVLAPTGAQPAAAHEAAAGPSYSSTTSVGLHNAYEKAKYPYFADALDSGAGMLELDVWTNVFGRSWRVSHSNPLGNDNNCVNAATAAELRAKPRNQDLGGCLSDIRAWHNANPGHRPIMLKMEFKDGFQGKYGRGPAALDALLTARLGDALFRPADLAGNHSDLDTAVRAGGWPARSDMAGKFIVELIPGTLEQENPFDTLWTDREYAEYLRGLAAAGRLSEAAAFPAVLGTQTGDPRSRYADATIRPWFVVFDGDASTFAGGSVDTAWYDRNHYLLVMTGAASVAPAIDGTNPTEAQAVDRVNLLAGKHATVVSTDWYPLPSVLSTVVPRGTAGATGSRTH